MKNIKPILKIYKPYEPLSRDISFTKIINEEYLNADLYKTDKDIKSSLGTGKTYSTFQYIHDNNIKILIICQLVNNVDNHIRDFRKHKNNTNEIILTASRSGQARRGWERPWVFVYFQAPLHISPGNRIRGPIRPHHAETKVRHATNGRSHAAVSAAQAMSTMSLPAAIVSRTAHTSWGTS